MPTTHNTTRSTLTNDGTSYDDGSSTQSIFPEMGPNTTRISFTQKEETFPKWPTHCQLFPGSFQTVDGSTGRRPLQHRPISLSTQLRTRGPLHTAQGDALFFGIPTGKISCPFSLQPGPFGVFYFDSQREIPGCFCSRLAVVHRQRAVKSPCRHVHGGYAQAPASSPTCTPRAL